MAFSEESGSGMVMPVSPMYGGNGNGFGFGGDWAWIILLLLLGWGNNGWGGNGYDGGAGGLYPWMNQAEITSGGFRDQMINNNITSIRDGIAGISTQLCNGFAQAEISANARQIADMQQMFALQSQFADCCCENRLATCQTQNIVQSEGSATRFADANNTRDIIDSQTRGTQAILDKLCALELDGVKAQLAQAERENIGLQNQLNMAVVQNGMNAEVDALYDRLKNCPVPSMPVYGSQPIFTCGGNNGCGCGCGNF